ncbi:Phosphoribosylaminoimidazole-succinocarboxamide synthase [Trichinella spiralis]|uniref:Phosphoribosylaminoimidazole-succinocarboxamide synthase n=1 Tax=Trichinella spiralis TaxID=6334 RepID=A0ABR3KRW2_TRISP
MYECRYCQKRYKDLRALYNHQKIHEMYGIYTKIQSRHKNGNYRKIQKADLTTTLIENNSNGSADENTNTNDKMVTTNFGNVVHDGIRQNSDKTNELIVRGNGEMQPESNTPRPPKIRKINLMPTPSNYDTTNTFGANTYRNYEMTNANSGNATVNGIYEYQEINRGDAALSTKSNILQTSQIQETNLMESSCYWNGNEAECGNTYATYNMGNADHSNVVVNENYGLDANFDYNYAANVCSAMNYSIEPSRALESHNAINVNAPLQSYENGETFFQVPYPAVSTDDGWIGGNGALSNVVPNYVSLIGSDENCNADFSQDAIQNTNHFADPNYYDYTVNDDTSQIQFQNAVSPENSFANAENEYSQAISTEYATEQVVANGYVVYDPMNQAYYFVNTGDNWQNGNAYIQTGDEIPIHFVNSFSTDEQTESNTAVTISNNSGEGDNTLNRPFLNVLLTDESIQLMDYLEHGHSFEWQNNYEMLNATESDTIPSDSDSE